MIRHYLLRAQMGEVTLPMSRVGERDVALPLELPASIESLRGLRAARRRRNA